MNNIPIQGKLVDHTRCKTFYTGKNGVAQIVESRDASADFIQLESGEILTKIYSGSGYCAMYPLEPVKIKYPVKAVLMDLDGTTVKSEKFWMSMLEKCVATILEVKEFSFSKEDLPFVFGHSVSEHLSYCIEKYMPIVTLSEARRLYLDIARDELKLIEEGKSGGWFVPTPGIKQFLLQLKNLDVKIALVTSGTYEKAWPEISDCFKTLDLGSPEEFYDVIITAGYSLFHGGLGTLGELTPKPHPWLYAEAACIGLGIPYEERNSIVGIEDSSAGILSLRLAGFNAIGLADGNIEEAGYGGMCALQTDSLDSIYDFICNNSEHSMKSDMPSN